MEYIALKRFLFYKKLVSPLVEILFVVEWVGLLLPREEFERFISPIQVAKQGNCYGLCVSCGGMYRSSSCAERSTRSAL